VGIGTTNPQSKMVVSNGSNSNITFDTLSGTNNNGFMSIGFNGGYSTTEYRFNTSKNRFRICHDTRSTTDRFAVDTWNGTTLSTPFTILTNSNIGIGQLSPAQRLEVNGNLAVGHRWGNNDFTTNVNIGKPDSTGGWGNGSCYITFKDSSNSPSTVNSGTSIIFTTHPWAANNAERMRIAANGNVGIGTTAPSEKLEVAGIIRSKLANGEGVIQGFDENHAIYLREGGGNLMTFYEFGDIRFMTNGFKPSQTEKMRITAGGNVGIGTTSPNAKLEVSGNILLSNHILTDNGLVRHGFKIPTVDGADRVFLICLNTAGDNECVGRLYHQRNSGDRKSVV
jgi:hypothetical protein